jgi:hypothetical protein
METRTRDAGDVLLALIEATENAIRDVGLLADPPAFAALSEDARASLLGRLPQAIELIEARARWAASALPHLTALRAALEAGLGGQPTQRARRDDLDASVAQRTRFATMQIPPAAGMSLPSVEDGNDGLLGHSALVGVGHVREVSCTSDPRREDQPNRWPLLRGNAVGRRVDDIALTPCVVEVRVAKHDEGRARRVIVQ